MFYENEKKESEIEFKPLKNYCIYVMGFFFFFLVASKPNPISISNSPSVYLIDNKVI
jgi:hypothetical protein